MFCKYGRIIITSVDDTIICRTNEQQTDEVLSRLKDLKMDFGHLGYLPSYLGVQIDHNDDGMMTLWQPHIIENMLDTLSLMGSTRKSTPAKKTIGKCLHHGPFNREFDMFQNKTQIFMFLRH